MKLIKQEEILNTEIEKLDQHIKKLEDLLINDKETLDNLINKLSQDEKELEVKLKDANENLKSEVLLYYNKKIIHEKINKILNYTDDEFEIKYKSKIKLFRPNSKGTLEETNISKTMLKKESFTQIIKNTSWKHESKKIVFFEWLKIIFYFFGAASLIFLVSDKNIEGFLSYLAIGLSLLTLSYTFFIYRNINFYEKGAINSFYEKFFKKNIEPVHQEEIIYLDSINELNKEIKQII